MHDARPPVGASLSVLSPCQDGSARFWAEGRRHAALFSWLSFGGHGDTAVTPNVPRVAWEVPRSPGVPCLWQGLSPGVGAGVYPSATVPPPSANGGTLIMMHFGQQPHHLGTEDVSLPKV